MASAFLRRCSCASKYVWLCSTRAFSSKVKPSEQKFSESPAFKQYRPHTASSRLDNIETPTFRAMQTFTILGSITAFFIYFGFLREPNDLDEELDKPLHMRVPQLEYEVLKDLIRDAKYDGADASKYEKRLAELEKQLDTRRYA